MKCDQIASNVELTGVDAAVPVSAKSNRVCLVTTLEKKSNRVQIPVFHVSNNATNVFVFVPATPKIKADAITSNV